jgi:diguanylate cyclase (GGDEF)-like protein
MEKVELLQPMSNLEFQEFLKSTKSPISKEDYDWMQDELSIQPTLSSSISYLKSFSKEQGIDDLVIYPWVNKKLRVVSLKEGTDLEDALLAYGLNEQTNFCIEKKPSHPRIAFSLQGEPFKRKEHTVIRKEDEFLKHLQKYSFYSQIFASPFENANPLGLIGLISEKNTEEDDLKEQYFLSIVRRAFRGKFKDQLEKTFDDDTGAYKKNYFKEIFPQIAKETKSAGRKIGFVYADLNYLKRANDKYGHDFGDEILRRTVEIYSDFTRGTDFIVRMGGDEFVIVYPGITEKKLDERLKKIEDVFSKTQPIVKGDFLTKPNISYGAVIIDPNLSEPEIERLKVQAEQKMYDHKKLFHEQFDNQKK